MRRETAIERAEFLGKSLRLLEQLGDRRMGDLVRGAIEGLNLLRSP